MSLRADMLAVHSFLEASRHHAGWTDRVAAQAAVMKEKIACASITVQSAAELLGYLKAGPWPTYVA